MDKPGEDWRSGGLLRRGSKDKAEGAAAEKAKGRVLLPDTVLPSRYDLHLVPDLERFVFDGKIDISVDVHEATNEITLHTKELQLIKASFVAEGSTEEINVDGINQNFKMTTATFIFAEMLPVGKGKFSIEFTGILNNAMAGFYRSAYTDIHGTKKIMCSTQFESLDARRCFPCWDEPARKAVFAVTMVVDSNLVALSNMPEKTVKILAEGSRHRREITFMDSPKMSTYLLAFVVGEFDFVQATTSNGVRVKVYTPHGRAEAGTFALEVGTKALDIYDDFFGLPYPLPKLDMVAIPEFACGAMENWGLVTYREVDLLIDQNLASGQQKQRVCIVVTHELAHQWFGNLVTMAWWDDLWLNEGFASWCENYSADLIFPDYKLWDQFASDALAAALSLDALKTSHPIQVPIAHAEEVEEVFDAISYCKGASVIRMAHKVLGHDAFRRGLQQYMKRHQYGNTETHDLWGAWAEVSGMAVKDMMSSWTEQMGFPLVEVTAFSIEGSMAKLSLKQSWFLSSGEDPPDDRVWTIPLFIRSSGQRDQPPVMLTTKTMDVQVPIGSDPAGAFVLLNDGVATPMRVSYAPEMRSLLTEAIAAGNVPPADRASLVMGSYSLAKAGKLGVDEVIIFLVAFYAEREYTVWAALSPVLDGLDRLFMGGAPQELYEKFRLFAENLVWRAWETLALGWQASPTDGHTDGMLRGLLMKLCAKFADRPAWLAEARRRFRLWVEDPNANAGELPDEYRVPVLQAVMQRGGEEEYTALEVAFGKLTKNVDQKHVYLSLGWTKEPALKTKAMMWAISGDVKIQDFFYLLAGVARSSREGLDMLWAFVQEKFSSIHTLIEKANPSLLDPVIEYSTTFCSEEKALEVEAFFATKKLPSNQRTISQVLESIRADASFLKRALAREKMTSPKFWSLIHGAQKSANPASTVKGAAL